jgi:hypothetical protein
MKWLASCLVCVFITSGLIVCLTAFAIPLATWIVAHLNTADLHQEASALQKEKQSLKTTIKNLKTEAGGGAEYFVDADGLSLFVLPPGLKIDKTVRLQDGRQAVAYTLSR